MKEVDAMLLNRSTQRAIEARLELSRPMHRFPWSLIWLVPGISMAVFGEALKNTFAANIYLVWLLALLVSGVCYACSQVALLQRKVDALAQLLVDKDSA